MLTNPLTMLARTLFRFTLLVVAGSLPASAADWREVGTVMERGITVYVDHASVKADHDIIAQGWVRFDYQNPQTHAGQPLSRHTSLRMVNCQNKRYWVSEWWGYPSSGGEPVQLASQSQEWQMPAPDSEAEMAVQALCAETQSIFGTVWAIVRGALSLGNN